MITTGYLATFGVLLALATVAAPVLAARWLATTRPGWWLRARRSVRRYRRTR